MNVPLFWQLQISHMGGVLLPWVVQFTALTQSLVVDRQGHRVHVHQLVVRDSGLVEEDRDRKGDWLYRLLNSGRRDARDGGGGAGVLLLSPNGWSGRSA